MIPPPVWDTAVLDAARQQSESHFRDGRHTEPLDLYLEFFDAYQGLVEEVLEETVDLLQIKEHAVALFSHRLKREVMRYLSGPPVSEDDLKVLMHARSLAPGRIAKEPGLVDSLVSFLRDWHDRRRFPWVSQGVEANEDQRRAAVLATTALIAMRKVETMRRNEGKAIQEKLVETRLLRSQFTQVAKRRIKTVGNAPKAGEFCRESYLGTRKADFVIGLWDGRIMPVECKVSNSATNSVKRLNNDAAAKAEAWRRDFGASQVVPAAVLSGVYKTHNLEEAQDRGLALFWAHDLQQMLDWLHMTKT